MSSTPPVRVGIIGVGLMARYHLTTMLPRDDTRVVAICEPNAAALEAIEDEFQSRGLPVPPNEPDWSRFIDRHAPELDAAFIITPHALHLAQAPPPSRRASTCSSRSRWCSRPPRPRA